MKNTFYAAALMAVAAMAMPGCFGRGKDKSQDAAQPEGAPGAEVEAPMPSLEEDPLYVLFRQAEELYSNGETNETCTILAEAFDNADFAQYKPQILQTLVRVLIERGDIDGARDRVVKAFSSGDEALADSVVGTIYFNYVNNGDNAAALAWTEEVLAIGNLPERIRRTFTEWHISAAIEAGDDERVATAAESLFAMAPANDAAEILRRSLETLVTRGKTDLLADIVARAGKSVTSDETTRNLLAVMRLRILALQSKWDELAGAFAATSGLPDKELSYALRAAIPLALKAQRHATIDAICEKIASDPDAGRMSAAYAARQWVASAAKTDVSKVPERIEALVNGPLNRQDVVSIFVSHAYDNIDDVTFAGPMKSLAERLIAASPEDSRSSLRTVLLDFSFIMEDYDTALALLNEGFSGYDENWHHMAISKVSAHKALKEERYLDAIRDFRDFMAIIQTSQEDTSDPTTGVVHTRDMILGRNAARIGDIYAKVPDAEKAAAAYAEARDYYGKALEVAKDADTIALIKKELAAIPAEK